MSATPYFFFRPLVAADRRWAAIDWRYASPGAIDGELLARCFAETDAAKLAKELPMVVPITPAALENPAWVDAFARDAVVFVLPATSLRDPQALTRCMELRRGGRHFALEVDHSEMLNDVLIDVFDHLSFDAAQVRQDFSSDDLVRADDAGMRKIVTKVDTHEMFGWLADKGFDWVDSHFLSAQNPLNAREPDLARLKLLRLLNLVKQDSDTHAIEEVFREEPKLSYNLLRLVNSVAVGAGMKISNFAQAITILGRRHLQRWLQMLVYADQLADGDALNPLMQLAALRARQMELLCEAIVPRPEIAELSDNAFMIGLFSLLEVLINLPTKEILKELPMHEAAVDALLRRSQGGVLGQLLASLVASEAGNFRSAAATLSRLGIDAATHARAQVEALHWAVNINIGK